MNIGEFFVILGVDAETVKVKDFVKGIGEIPVKAAAGIAALAGISLGIKDMAQDAMDAAVAFGAFEAQTGLSSQELQTWQRIAMQANVSAEAVTSSVTSLQRQISEIRLGRGNISPFQMLGIDPRQDAFKVIEQLRQRIKGMDRGTATNMISQMGLTPDMMQVLTLSEEKFRAFSHTVVGMSPKQIQAFQNLKLELTKLKMALHDVMFRVLGSLLPLFLPLIHSILPGVTGFVENLVSGLVQLTTWLGSVKGVLPTLGIAFAALALVFMPVTAGIAALLLILEDLYVWSKGGTSLFGTAFAALKDIFSDPLASARAFLDIINEIIESVKKFIGFGKDAEGGKPGKNLFERFKDASMIGKLAGLTSGMMLAPAAVAAGPGVLGVMGMHKLMNPPAAVAGEAGGSVMDGFKMPKLDLLGPMRGLAKFVTEKPTTPSEGMSVPAVPGAAGGAGTTIQQTNNAVINIASTAPAEDVAKAAKREFDRNVNSASLQTENGGY